MVLSWLTILYYLGPWREMSNPNADRKPPACESPARRGGPFLRRRSPCLEAEVGRLLASAPKPESPRRPKARIVPHAGYPYSGQVAASGFATLSRGTPP